MIKHSQLRFEPGAATIRVVADTGVVRFCVGDVIRALNLKVSSVWDFLRSRGVSEAKAPRYTLPGSNVPMVYVAEDALVPILNRMRQNRGDALLIWLDDPETSGRLAGLRAATLPTKQATAPEVELESFEQAVSFLSDLNQKAARRGIDLNAAWTAARLADSERSERGAA